MTHEKMNQIKEMSAVEYLKVGKTFLEKGELIEAIACFRTSIELNPKFLAAYQNLGDALVTQEQLDGAINCYRKAIKLEPNMWEFWHKLGKTWLKKEQLEKAIAALNRSIELNPDFPWSYYQLGDALQQIGELDKAINVYSQAVRLQPDIWNVYHKLGNIFVKQGKFEAAVAAYRIGLQQKPELDWLHKKLGDALQSLGRQEEAVKSYRKAIEINPDICWNYGLLVQEFFGINRAYTNEKVVALTYDDGPEAPYTNQILDILDRYRIKATFFYVGQQIKKYPELVKQIFARGHQLANHSYSHPDMISSSAEQIKLEIESCDRLLQQLGVTEKIAFRPPWGRRSLLLLDLILEMQKPLIMWDIDAEDYRQEDTPEIIANRVIKMVQPGSIILLHDASLRTVGATEIIIKNLQTKGYSFKTIFELLKLDVE